ncbi:hypothetical protein LOSG293_350030 [Secundilactobacillus oryzae JCM 18671]|uniref:Uncharacterized protein n=1 Tax=Secundilactobacillus oryzae JCM 18671 TaxID=1291743 RepID=A0A081BKE7_9LACO|nr:hypothetical protein [Secundilactobacillus oryzae]GAK48515.1 hypothetical protein LOSG293_350030 [Secundilactobacillus oryzae JCM 18671]
MNETSSATQKPKLPQLAERKNAATIFGFILATMIAFVFGHKKRKHKQNEF